MMCPCHGLAKEIRVSRHRDPIERAATLRALMDNAEPRHTADPNERQSLRIAADFTQQELALAVGVGLRTIASWEAGEHTARHKHALAYAKALGALGAMSC